MHRVIPDRRNIGAYALLLPALVIMTVSGVVPMGFVAYYSVHDTFGGNVFVWVGATWFTQIFTSHEFHGALLRSAAFCAVVLAVEIPLGVYVALRLPSAGT